MVPAQHRRGMTQACGAALVLLVGCRMQAPAEVPLAAAQQVQLQPVDSQQVLAAGLRMLVPAAAAQRQHAGQQFRQRKGFDQIVVGAVPQPLDPVFDLVPRGQHQDRPSHPAESGHTGLRRPEAGR
ncbi:hypothetical protein G6F31_019908 [Rhizopus arrhizus]|nr:hypothetical protein G6F31_019908 [Rhizopus arrhizus]